MLQRQVKLTFIEKTRTGMCVWLVMNTLKTRDGPIYTGSELGELKNCLPIIGLSERYGENLLFKQDNITQMQFY